MNDQLELFRDLPVARRRASKEYGEFTDKFKVKLTTDDCYTPEPVYNAVKDWTVKKYGLQGRLIVRPFWPGGDFETFDYPENCVVIDNPPFSIYDKILNVYTNELKVDFMLFGPSLTLFKKYDACYIVCNEDVRYANGAVVKTSFVTSLDKENRVICDTTLNRTVREANAYGKPKKADLPLIEYPSCLITSARLGKTARTDFAFKRKDTAWVAKLNGKRLFGSGFLLSDRAAADRAAERKKVVVQLLPEELEIIRKLNEKGTNNG